jgi:iron(III) transport system permease protein
LALPAAAVFVALLVAVPVLGIVGHLFQPTGSSWREMAATVLPDYLATTFWLLLGVGAGTAIAGIATGWLVAMCRFPGRTLFEWALVLPLAMPAYVMAYCYGDLLTAAGPVQSLLRTLTGWHVRDYWFPEVSSLGGAIVLLTCVFYPYVYLLARTAFLEQSVCVLDAGRTLGSNAWRVFWRVALPLARPAIVAGVALALMEALADFGAVAYLSVQTFTTAIYSAWFSFGDRVAAAQLAAILLLLAFALLTIERVNRSSRRFHHTSSHVRPLPAYDLRGWRAAFAIAACALPILVGFAIPALRLAWLALGTGDAQWGARYVGLVLNSLTLSISAAIIAVLVATLLAWAARQHRSALLGAINRFAGMGYAVPGSIIAVGLLIPLAAFDNAFDRWLRETIGVSSGLLLTGSIVAIVYGYVVRFLAVSLQSVEASLAKVTPSMDSAARTLGARTPDMLWRVHRPLVSGGLLTAGLIVFVEAMKELPATMIMRPFGVDTLAVQAFNLARDERLAEASTSALTIVVVGLVPVILISRAIRQRRAGAPDGAEALPGGAPRALAD